MTTKEFHLYWAPAAMNILGVDRRRWEASSIYDRAMLFAKLIGQEQMYEDYADHNDMTPLDPDLKELLIKFAGPHGKTLFKAWQAKHGVKA